MTENSTSKKLIIFDLDGTLAESKSSLDVEMSQLLSMLLARKRIAVISGGFFPQFEKQVLRQLFQAAHVFMNLYLFPTSGACAYTYQHGEWCLLYAHNLTGVEKQKIFNAFEKAFEKLSYTHPARLFGEVIEDRGAQITFSAIGQSAPLAEKERWKKNNDKRAEIQSELVNFIPEFEVRISGMTSIDVTKKGIDKAYGIAQMEKFLNIPKSEMLFVGDALFEGGNDYPVKAAGVDTIAVTGPEDTKKLIQSML